MNVEIRHDALVEQLKEELCGVIFMHQEEEYLEVEEMKKEIDKEFALDIRDEHFDESKEEESCHEESAKASEYEEKETLRRIFGELVFCFHHKESIEAQLDKKECRNLK